MDEVLDIRAIHYHGSQELVFHFIIVVGMKISKLIKLRVSKSVLPTNQFSVREVIHNKANSLPKPLMQLILVKRLWKVNLELL